MFYLIANHKKGFFGLKSLVKQKYAVWISFIFKTTLRALLGRILENARNLLAGYSRSPPILQHVFIFPYSSILF